MGDPTIKKGMGAGIWDEVAKQDIENYGNT